jgi:hypothetical protein
MTSTRRIPISKKCGLCKTIKLLNEFEIDEKKKDKHAAICKEYITKHNNNNEYATLLNWYKLKYIELLISFPSDLNTGSDLATQRTNKYL